MSLLLFCISKIKNVIKLHFIFYFLKMDISVNPFQAKNARGEGFHQADFLGVLTCFQGTLSISNMLVFTIIFDVYDTYGAEVSDHMSLLYTFSFNCYK